MREILKKTLIIAIILSSPIWVIPYLLYHYREIEEGID